MQPRLIGGPTESCCLDFGFCVEFGATVSIFAKEGLGVWRVLEVESSRLRPSKVRIQHGGMRNLEPGLALEDREGL